MSDFGSLDSSDEMSQEFAEEVKAFNRIGLKDDFTTKGMSRLEKSMIDPLDRFKNRVHSILYKMIELNVIKLNEKTIDNIIDKSEKLNHVYHKNPHAYILGYISTNGGVSLEKEKFDYTINNILPNIEDDYITPPDVLRYSRLLLSM